MIATKSLNDRSPVPTRRIKFTTYVLPEVGERVRKIARDENRTDSQLVSTLIEEALIARGEFSNDELIELRDAFLNSER